MRVRPAWILGPLLAVLLALGASWLLARHAGPPFALRIEGSATVATHAQLYYDRGHGLSETDSVRLPIFPGAAVWQFALPPGRYVGFRFDPVDRDGSVLLRDASLRARGKLVRTLPLAAFRSAQQVEREERGQSVAFTAVAGANDPQVVIALATPLVLQERWSDAFVGGEGGFIATVLAAVMVALLLQTPPLRPVWRRCREAIDRGDRFAPLPGGGRPATWVVLLLLAVEVAVFAERGAHDAAAIYPRWNDQVQYLSETYDAYDDARAHGVLAGAWHALVNPSAQGTLHDVYGMLACLVAGPSRAAVLTVNVLMLAVWQLALFVVVRRLTRDGWFAAVAAMLPLLLGWPWQDGPGTMADFRLDHLALCALGVVTAAGLLTEGLRIRRWSVVFGVAVGIAVLTRFLTLAYFVGILASFVIWIAVQPDRRRRYLNLALATLVAALLCGPVLWLNRALIFNYYVVGHYVGSESAIRNQHFGLWQSIRYVLGRFAIDQVGAALWAVTLAVLVVLLLGMRGMGAARRWRWPRGWMPMAAILFAAPAIVLIAHPQKSFVVLGVMTPGFVALVLGLWWALWQRTDRLLRGLVVVGVACVAVGVFVWHESHPMYDAEERQTSARVRDIAALIDRLAQQRSGPTRLGIDWVTDALDGRGLRVICYEKFHHWLQLEMTLPTGIEAPTREMVFDRLAQSDYVIVTTSGGGGLWPFDQTLEHLRPEVLAWCRDHARPLAEYQVGYRYVTVFERTR